jgi:hypothetical protein
MPSAPSKSAEAIVAILTPPACREEVLGDLYERYRSPAQYGFEALITIPLVILSRIRRTADPQVLMMQALALYLAFLGAAWFRDSRLLSQEWGILRLALPPGLVLLALVLDDAYAKPGRRSPGGMMMGPAIGLGLAFLSQAMLRSRNSPAALPVEVMVYGSAMSFLSSSAIRILFPPVTNRAQGVGAPADWLKQTGDPIEIPRGAMQLGAGLFTLLAALIVYELWWRR